MKPLKSSVSQKTTCKKEYKIVTNDKISEPYWDDGINYYRPKGPLKNKRIFNHQYRQFRTWKHNRRKQWR